MNKKPQKPLLDLEPLSVRDTAQAKKEIEYALLNDSLPPTAPISDSDASAEDIKKTGVIASEFLQGLDKVSTVLMTLVLRFGRATNMMRLVLAGMGVGILMFGTALVTTYSLNQRMGDMVETLKETQKGVSAAAAKSTEAARQAAEAKDQAKAAEEAAPKVIYDEETKKYKLILQSVEEDGDGEKKVAPKAVDIKLN